MKKKELPINPDSIDLEDLVTTPQAAKLLRMHPMTLQINRSRPNPIPFIRIGRKVLYRVQDLRELVAAGYHGRTA